MHTAVIKVGYKLLPFIACNKFWEFSIGSNKNLLIYTFLYRHQLSAWYFKRKASLGHCSKWKAAKARELSPVFFILSYKYLPCITQRCLHVTVITTIGKAPRYSEKNEIHVIAISPLAEKRSLKEALIRSVRSMSPSIVTRVAPFITNRGWGWVIVWKASKRSTRLRHSIRYCEKVRHGSSLYVLACRDVEYWSYLLFKAVKPDLSETHVSF